MMQSAFIMSNNNSILVKTCVGVGVAVPTFMILHIMNQAFSVCMIPCMIHIYHNNHKSDNLNPLALRLITRLLYGEYVYTSTCADLEGGSGGSGPPLEFAKLNIADFTGNEKNSYFSYLCTSTVIRQGWTPPGKIFWIRACIYIIRGMTRTKILYSEYMYMYNYVCRFADFPFRFLFRVLVTPFSNMHSNTHILSMGIFSPYFTQMVV